VTAKTTFAGRLRALREAAGLSVAQLAAKTGDAPERIHNLEAGRRRDPRLSTLLKLARGLGTDLNALAEGLA
jgi:transcriptional regulator with XRE-family HTH domain